MAILSKEQTEVKAKRKPAEEVGIVASDKMQKTIVVSLIRRVKHAKYGKFFTKTKRVKAHDENNEAKIGDQVLLVESRPLSKEKRYALKKVLRKA
jgi:small subunit ribosomal protein S17